METIKLEVVNKPKRHGISRDELFNFLTGQHNDNLDFRYKSKRKKYGKYADAITRAKLVHWLKKCIDISDSNDIRIMTREIAKKMGEEFEKKSYTTIYCGVKFVLFHNGIVVNIGTSKSNEHMLIMRRRNKEDQLPPSLKD